MRERPIVHRCLLWGWSPQLSAQESPAQESWPLAAYCSGKAWVHAAPTVCSRTFWGLGVCNVAQGHRLSHSLLAVSSTQKSELAESVNSRPLAVQNGGER